MGKCYDAHYTPDGGTIFFEHNNDIWMMRADGTGSLQLTTNGSDDGTPIADPQKRWIYFVSNRGYKWGIWRIPWPSGMGG